MRKRLLRIVLSFILCLLAPAALQAELRLTNIFASHMVLQRDLAVPVWGWAAPGSQVTVRFAGQEKKATANNHGRWNVRLDAMPASSDGRSMHVSGDGEVTFQDVLVGDVWICSGQSNMEWSVKASANPDQEIKAAAYPGIRLFDVPGHTTSRVPKVEVPGTWKSCTPENIPSFSAVGYFFGRHIHREANVPIGLIGSNWGGTRIEPWTPPVGFRSVPELKQLAVDVNRFDATVPSGKVTWNRYIQDVETWVRDARQAMRDGTPIPQSISPPGYTGAGQPTAIYNSMIHPLAPYGVRGAIWYQGESNGGEGREYFHKMQALIKGWRSVWGQGDFPLYFYFVQLANFKAATDDPAGGDGYARVREAQRETLSVPHTGMAVIIDIGEAGDIHPRNKQDVGIRLARWALRDVCGQSDLVPSGPLYKSLRIEGGRAILEFDHVGGGLMVGKKSGLEPTQEDSSNQLKRFAVAGKDRKWHWADARIVDKTVVVSSDEVPQPVAVRYAYAMNPEGRNLYNKEGLPASPFRTDDW